MQLNTVLYDQIQFVVVFAAVLLVCFGCDRSDEDSFLFQVSSANPVEAHPGGGRAYSSSTGIVLLREAHKQGIDIRDLLRKVKDDSELREDIFYLLLLDQDETLVEELESEPSDLEDWKVEIMRSYVEFGPQGHLNGEEQYIERLKRALVQHASSK